MDLFTNLRTRVSRRDDDRGAILILTALVMLLLLFIAAFATDLGAWYRQGQAQQQAADVSSLNGVQAYDREVQAYLESFGPDTIWNDLSEAEREEGERRAMLAVVNTVIGLLETSGLDFSNPNLVDLQLSIPPNMLGDESIATIEADDGTVVTIVRSVIEVDGVFVSTISVSITAPGQQFISGILRDAPDISSSAESTVSNCGAECEREVTIDPPFAGFNAGGSGDGLAPLLNGDPFLGQATQVWAVNHHSNFFRGDIQNNFGDIVCRSLEDRSNCGEFSLNNYLTPIWPQEILAQDVGKIYFPATNRNTGTAGVACFDIVTNGGQFCDREFIGFWEHGGTVTAAGNRINASGNQLFNGSPATSVWRYQNQIWVASDSGQFACVTMSAAAHGGMQSCQIDGGGNPVLYDTAGINSGVLRTPGQVGGRSAHTWGNINPDNEREVHMFSRSDDGQAVFHCFDFQARNPCWGGAHFNAGNVAKMTRASGFQVFDDDAAGTYLGICAFSTDDDTVICRDENGGPLTPPNNIKTSIKGIGDGFTGHTFVWYKNGRADRLFFNGGASDVVACYDFRTQNVCGETNNGIVVVENILPTQGRDPDGNKKFVEPYQLVDISDECLLGLGDESIFFSLSPERLTGCVDTTTSTVITPCLCTGTAIPNWAAIELPQDLLDSVNLLEATARDATPGAGGNFEDGVDEFGMPCTDCVYEKGSGPIIGGIQDVDVLADGIVDLGAVPNSVTAIELVLRVDSKINPGTQLPEFDAPATFDISIISQPTLTN